MDQSEDRGCSVALHNSQLIYFALSFIHLLGEYLGPAAGSPGEVGPPTRPVARGPVAVLVHSGPVHSPRVGLKIICSWKMFTGFNTLFMMALFP